MWVVRWQEPDGHLLDATVIQVKDGHVAAVGRVSEVDAVRLEIGLILGPTPTTHGDVERVVRPQEKHANMYFNYQHICI